LIKSLLFVIPADLAKVIMESAMNCWSQGLAVSKRASIPLNPARLVHGSLVKMSPPLERHRVSQVETKVETSSSKETETESCSEKVSTSLASKPPNSLWPWLRAQKRVERRVAVVLAAAVELSTAVGSATVVLPASVGSAAVVLPASVGSVTVALAGGATEGSVTVELSDAVGSATGISVEDGPGAETDPEGATAAQAAGAVVRLEHGSQYLIF
jgi:hypothetical protein